MALKARKRKQMRHAGEGPSSKRSRPNNDVRTPMAPCPSYSNHPPLFQNSSLKRSQRTVLACRLSLMKKSRPALKPPLSDSDSEQGERHKETDPDSSKDLYPSRSSTPLFSDDEFSESDKENVPPCHSTFMQPKSARKHRPEVVSPIPCPS